VRRPDSGANRTLLQVPTDSGVPRIDELEIKEHTYITENRTVRITELHHSNELLPYIICGIYLFFQLISRHQRVVEKQFNFRQQ